MSLVKEIERIKRINFSRMPLAIKASIAFTLCNFFLKGIGFITAPLFARLLSVDEYGYMNVYNSYQQIFLIFATFEISNGAYQRGILKYKNKKRLFTISTQLLSTMLTLILFLICILFMDQITSFIDISPLIMILMFIYFLFQPSYNYWLIDKRMSFDYKPAVLTTILFSLMPTIISLIVVVFYPTGEAKIVITLIVAILCYILFYVRNIDLKKVFNNLNEVLAQWKFILKFQLPLVPHSLSYLILGQSDRVMISKMIGNAAAGLYSAANTIALALTIFQTSINQVFLPWCYKKIEKKEYTDIGRISMMILICVAVIVICFILVAPEIVKVFFPVTYVESIICIPPMMMSVFFMFQYSLFVNIETYFGKTNYVMIVSTTCACLNIGMNYIALHLFGYVGCAYTTMVCYFLFAVGHFFFYRKVCNDFIDGTEIHNSKAIFIITACTLIIFCLISIFYKSIIIRYSILLILLLLVVLKSSKIIYLFKEMHN